MLFIISIKYLYVKGSNLKGTLQNRWEFIKENKKATEKKKDKKKDNTLSIKKVDSRQNDNDQEKEGRKWKTQIRIKYFLTVNK